MSVARYKSNCTVPECTRKALCVGLCPMHYRRKRLTGEVGCGAKFERGRPLADRLWEKVDKRGPNECWQWKTTSLVRGYGYIRGDNGKSMLAHRVAYQLARGDMPPGLDVCHHCDNRLCCNPSHLFLGTRADNMADCKAKGRTPAGEKHPAAKLTTAQVIAIRASAGPPREIAAHFGISKGTVSDIRLRRRWGHVQ